MKPRCVATQNAFLWDKTSTITGFLGKQTPALRLYTIAAAFYSFAENNTVTNGPDLLTGYRTS
jgi:hypothetical protein